MDPLQAFPQKKDTKRNNGGQAAGSGEPSGYQKVYKVWYRDDSQPDIDRIPDIPIYKTLRLDELLSAMEGHSVTHMSISGDIPPLNQIAPGLKELVLRDIEHEGQLESITSLNCLEQLSIDESPNLCSLPDEMRKLKSLKSLEVLDTGIPVLPESIRSLSCLESLSLIGNGNLHTLPDCIGELKSLKELDISLCGLTGLPNSIRSLSCLKILNLYSNESLQTLPECIGELKSLKELNISLCGLTGLPNSIGSLSCLETLNLRRNMSLHTLPDCIGELKSLKALDITNCDLTGLPDSIGSLSCLETLNLGWNMGLHTLPDWIGELKSLKELDISYCGLTGLPDRIHSQSIYEALNRRRNKRLHTLPDCIGELKSLKELNISHCGLTGLPNSIGSLSCLEKLDLGGNKSLHTLPDCIGELKSLKGLDISHCGLTGLPNSIGSLSCLEKLDLGGNKSLHTLPDCIGELKSLKGLDISHCGLTGLPNSIRSLSCLETLNLRGNESLHTLPDWIGELKNLKELNISHCGLTGLPNSIRSLSCLKILNLYSNESLHTLPDCIGELKSLKALHISECGLTGLPNSILSLSCLETLNLRGNESLHTLPDWIGELKNLKELNISHCGLTGLPNSIGSLSCLETLNLRANMSLHTLPDWIGELKNLKELDICGCGLTGLPNSIGVLSCLETLDLSANKSLHTLPDCIGELKSLKALHISECGLTGLPNSIGSLHRLEKLKISFNEGLCTLPDWIKELRSLKVLDLAGSSLSELPPSIGALSNLEKMNLADNPKLGTLHESIAELKSLKQLNVSGCQLLMLPESVSGLSSLEVLDISRNRELTRLPVGINKLSKLETLQIKECDALTFPPNAVCEQGIEAIQKYLTDFEEGTAKKFIPVTVIGETLAGKTSLVKSMQHDRRVLTYRSTVSKLDEATKIFIVHEADVDDKSRLVFHDFGGQVIYQFGYQLSCRSKFVPLLVIDIAKFDELVVESGVEAACEKLCLDWLSHLYLSCPQADSPLLVLTHCDKFENPELLEKRQTDVIQGTESLRSKIRKEELAMAPNSSPFFSMKSFSATSQPLLTKYKPMLFHKDSARHDIRQLKAALHKIGLSLLTEIPECWYELMELCETEILKEIPFLTLEQIDEMFPGDKERFILQYLHDIGKIIWYRNRDKLAHIVFHRIELLTGLVQVLFNHSAQESWVQRLEAFVPFNHNGRGIQKRKYQEMVHNFQETGMMNSILLSNLIEHESALDPEISIEVLKVFHLVCGPIREENEHHYILPYFSKRLITVAETGNLIPMKVEICFTGLPFPIYLYHLLTAIYANRNMTELNRIDAGRNGACVSNNDGTVKYLFHSHTERIITIQALTKSKSIAKTWKSLLSDWQHLISELMLRWKGVHFETVFYCSHCLLTEQWEPTIKVDPDWGVGSTLVYTGEEACRCTKGQPAHDLLTVPLPLFHPCGSITNDGIQALDTYILGIQQRNAQSAAPSSQATSPPNDRARGAAPIERNPAALEQAQLDDIVAIVNSGNALIDLEPELGVRIQNDQIYDISETRGRALILSNSCNGTRQGSEHDYANMKRMLDKLGFITVGAHRNFHAHDMVAEIHKETHLVNEDTGDSVHEELKSFVLVITSHGHEGSVVGSDHKYIKIMDLINLLSPKNFPAMKGKPKIVIIQACSGSNREMMLTNIPREPAVNQNPPQGNANQLPPVADADDDFDDISPEDISTADFIIMQSSFESFASPRRPSKGSPFIRALVTVFYKYAHLLHMEELAAVIRQIVASTGVQRTEELLRTYRRNTVTSHVASMPQTRCTFLSLKLYLQPGIDMRTDHPNVLRNPLLPDPTGTIIERKHDEIFTIASQGQNPRQQIFYKWVVSL